VIIEMDPPVDDVLSPAFTATRPPEACFPEPTTTLILPEIPDVAEPVRKLNIPVPPFVLVPDEKDKDPVTPATPDGVERTLNAPLDDVRP
jgi:hypothetical protein